MSKRARWPGMCSTCDRAVKPGQRVARWGGQWQHEACVAAQREVGRILAGETFAGSKPAYRRGKGPGHAKG